VLRSPVVTTVATQSTAVLQGLQGPRLSARSGWPWLPECRCTWNRVDPAASGDV